MFAALGLAAGMQLASAVFDADSRNLHIRGDNDESICNVRRRDGAASQRV